MAIKAEASFSLKDQLFNRESLSELTTGFLNADPDFDVDGYTRAVLNRFPGLELKQRIDWMVTALEDYVPEEFQSACRFLQDALPPPLDPDKSDDDFGRFIWVVPGEYVARHGCTEEYLGISLAFLKENTKRFSMENPVRPFLRDFQQQTTAFLKSCTKDANYHVRRWTSEGIRPFLPWSERVILPTAEILDVLGRLHADSTRYVTRSVANCLNDISKIDPDAVIETLQGWADAGRQEPKELGWMTSHALRTLAKTDHAAALELLGFTTRPKFEISGLEATQSVALGSAFKWNCLLTSLTDQKLKITLRIDFLKSNGKHAPKVFAVATRAMKKDEVFEVQKQQPFRAITTRTLYPGTHYAELLVNGVSAGKVEFEFHE